MFSKAANSVELLNGFNIVKEGDTHNYFHVRLIDSDGVDVLTAGTEITWSMFNLKDKGTVIANKVATLGDPGTIFLYLAPEDVTGYGRMGIEISVTYVDGTVEKFPADKPIDVIISKSSDNLVETPVSYASLSYLEQQVTTAETAATNAETSASNAQTAAVNASTTATDIQTEFGDAKTDADGTVYPTVKDRVDAEQEKIVNLKKHKSPQINILEAFGSDTTGVTDSTQYVTDAIASLDNIEGGKIKFPNGKYNLASNGRIEINGKKNIILEGELFTKLFNDTKTGNTGDMLVFIGCENILIRNLEIACPSGNAYAYDNALVFLDCKNVTVELCRFTKTSNKHIHIGGQCENIDIENNYFEESHFNSNPTLSSQVFGSVFFHYEDEVKTKITNVKVNNNTFKNNPLYAVSVWNHETTLGEVQEDAITDVEIKGNTFVSCGYPVATRGKRIKFEGNTVVDCGYKNIQDYYVWDSATSRYFSKYRQAQGQIPDATNTIPNSQSKLVQNLAGRYNTIKNNHFVRCMEYQVNTDNPITNTIFVEGRLAKHCEVKGNKFDDEKSTTYPNAYGMWFGNTGEDTKFNLVEDNTFILNPNVALTKQLIRFDVLVNTIRKNRAYNTTNGWMYQSTLDDEKEIIYQNGKYYSLTINDVDGSSSWSEVAIGVDF